MDEEISMIGSQNCDVILTTAVEVAVADVDGLFEVEVEVDVTLAALEMKVSGSVKKQRRALG